MEEMSAFHKMIAGVRSALETKRPARASHAEIAPAAMPVAPGVRLAQLTSQFARELEQVDGRFIGLLSANELSDRVVALTQQLEVRRAALGEGVVFDLSKTALALEQAGVSIIRAGYGAEPESAIVRDQIASCDLGIIEADYGIASTGTFVVLSTPTRPSSLTLLPPVNLILVAADRILPDLAAAISALGPQKVMAHRVALITGPSRTADIEKMIVIGVHGPKQLYAAALSR